MQSNDDCPVCEGNGQIKCDVCKGSGQVIDTSDADYTSNKYRECGECDGEKWIDCKHCNGSGKATPY